VTLKTRFENIKASSHDTYSLIALMNMLTLFAFLIFFSITTNVARLQYLSSTQATLDITFQALVLYGLLALLRGGPIRFAIKLLLVLIATIDLFLRMTYDSPLSVGIAMSIFTSSVSESVEFVEINFTPLFISTLLFLGLVFLSPLEKPLINRISLVTGIAYILIPTLASTNLLFSSDAFADAQEKGTARSLKVWEIKLEYLTSDIAERFRPLESLIGVSDTLRMIYRQVNLESTWTNVSRRADSPKLLVIGIGESLRAGNLGILGYHKDTTPRLKAMSKSLNIYTQAYSGGTNTWSSVPVALTKFSGEVDFSKSIINLAKDAGYVTHWYSNQGRYSHWDFSVSAIANQADDVYFVSENHAGSQYDHILVEKLNELITDKTREERHLIILNFYGSHWDFGKRYPPEFDVFTDKSPGWIDAYDNSVLYTDYVLSEAFNLVSSAGGEFLFFSDHGLIAPGNNGELTHDVRNNPSLDSIHVPLITSSSSKLNLNTAKPISLFYLECIFEQWSGITADELHNGDYCLKALSEGSITFLDSRLTIHEASSASLK
jgi:glucan phosphoethanolaminetransferase (alkaline phosphatase superfamily)